MWMAVDDCGWLWVAVGGYWWLWVAVSAVQTCHMHSLQVSKGGVVGGHTEHAC